MPRPRFTPGKGPPLPIQQEAGWAPEPVWTQRLEGKSSVSVGDRSLVVHSVVRHYSDWATPAPSPGAAMAWRDFLTSKLQNRFSTWMQLWRLKNPMLTMSTSKVQLLAILPTIWSTDLALKVRGQNVERRNSLTFYFFFVAVPNPIFFMDIKCQLCSFPNVQPVHSLWFA
jgi:hypothetical protein